MVNSFNLTLNSQQAAVAVTVSQTTQLPEALAQLGLSHSHPVLVIVGGASLISEVDFLRIQNLFVEVLAPIAQSLGAYVVDGGTDAGVMRLMGNARSQINGDFPLIGVAPLAKVILPEQTVLSEDATALEPHHTHFVLVPGNNWGDESPWIVNLATLLANQAPSITVLINGGEISFIDALNSIIAGRLVIVIAGSGRTADKLASALDRDTTDERAQKLAASGLLQKIDLAAKQDDLINEITQLLA
ncbi:hypothetical protein [Nostoc sp. FACHB-280]|uniref:hypothetical protein n=1 Tax=Nostoc sp. FACHB-280 TaxID=2692839 RepID=UPI00168AFC12|nr:hypothetical protein [Nostoc sp. FACHB-280]MBD2498961.1 hypothetical protein [Nostoc sp. FACHB-280]